VSNISREKAEMELRDRCVLAALPHVPFDGWSLVAIRNAAQDLELPDGAVEQIFPSGLPQFIGHFSRWADRRMLAALQETDLSHLPIREKVSLAVELRLETLKPSKEAVRRGLSWLAMPQNALLGARLLYSTVDDIWYAVGDRSADFSFYTKRGLLAGVIGSTTFCWLDDVSENGVETSEFLSRRIGDVMKIQAVRQRGVDARNRITTPLRLLRDVVRKRYDFGSTLGDSRL
jgi:ubiquinone biosynthesis protein COQ9